jgi:transketolase
MPMGMADIAEVLWRHHLKHNPANPGWVNRDRFVLSNGHGSMLLYALLHLSGYDLPIEPSCSAFGSCIRRLRVTPSSAMTAGVETTTGPLGQGLANAVGMALAERSAGARPSTARSPDRRPLHLCLHRRWLSDGRRFARGLFVGWTPVAVETDRFLRRQ